MDEQNINGQLYEATNILLRALEFNARCVIASYNTDDADRRECMEHVSDVYDMFYTELDTLFDDEEEIMEWLDDLDELEEEDSSDL